MIILLIAGGINSIVMLCTIVSAIILHIVAVRNETCRTNIRSFLWFRHGNYGIPGFIFVACLLLIAGFPIEHEPSTKPNSDQLTRWFTFPIISVWILFLILQIFRFTIIPQIAIGFLITSMFFGIFTYLSIVRFSKG